LKSLSNLSQSLQYGNLSAFWQKIASLDQTKGLKTACLLSAVGGRIVASAHPMFVAVDVWQTEQQEDYL
jgi:hypothetical protein